MLELKKLARGFHFHRGVISLENELQGFDVVLAGDNDQFTGPFIRIDLRGSTEKGLKTAFDHGFQFSFQLSGTGVLRRPNDPLHAQVILTDRTVDGDQ